MKEVENADFIALNQKYYNKEVMDDEEIKRYRTYLNLIYFEKTNDAKVNEFFLKPIQKPDNYFQMLDINDKISRSKTEYVNKYNQTFLRIASHLADENSFKDLQKEFGINDEFLIDRKTFYDSMAINILKDKKDVNYYEPYKIVDMLVYNQKELYKKMEDKVPFNIETFLNTLQQQRKQRVEYQQHLYKLNGSIPTKYLGSMYKTNTRDSASNLKTMFNYKIVANNNCAIGYDKDKNPLFDPIYCTCNDFVDNKNRLKSQYFAHSQAPLIYDRDNPEPYKTLAGTICNYQKYLKSMGDIFGVLVEEMPIRLVGTKEFMMFKRNFEMSTTEILNISTFQSNRLRKKQGLEKIKCKLQVSRQRVSDVANAPRNEDGYYVASDLEMIAYTAKGLCFTKMMSNKAPVKRHSRHLNAEIRECIAGNSTGKLFKNKYIKQKTKHLAPLIKNLASLLAARYILWAYNLDKSGILASRRIDLGLEYAFANQLALFPDKKALWALPIINKLATEEAYSFYKIGSVTPKMIEKGMLRVGLTPFPCKDVDASETTYSDFNNVIYGNSYITTQYVVDHNIKSHDLSGITNFYQVDKRINEIKERMKNLDADNVPEMGQSLATTIDEIPNKPTTDDTDFDAVEKTEQPEMSKEEDDSEVDQVKKRAPTPTPKYVRKDMEELAQDTEDEIVDNGNTEKSDEYKNEIKELETVKAEQGTGAVLEKILKEEDTNSDVESQQKAKEDLYDSLISEEDDVLYFDEQGRLNNEIIVEDEKDDDDEKVDESEPILDVQTVNDSANMQSEEKVEKVENKHGEEKTESLVTKKNIAQIDKVKEVAQSENVKERNLDVAKPILKTSATKKVVATEHKEKVANQLRGINLVTQLTKLLPKKLNIEIQKYKINLEENQSKFDADVDVQKNAKATKEQNLNNQRLKFISNVMLKYLETNSVLASVNKYSKTKVLGNNEVKKLASTTQGNEQAVYKVIHDFNSTINEIVIECAKMVEKSPSKFAGKTTLSIYKEYSKQTNFEIGKYLEELIVDMSPKDVKNGRVDKQNQNGSEGRQL